MKEFKHKCELRLLVCEPNPFRPDRVTVGFVLRDNSGDEPRVEVRLAKNLKAIQCVYPNADLEAIEGALLEMEPILKNVTDFEQYLQNLPFDVPADFSFLPGTAVLTDSIDAEVARFTQQYLAVEKRVPTGTEEQAGTSEGAKASEDNQVGRPYILRKMQEAFREFGLWNFLQKGIPAGKYTFDSDPLKIDFAYRSAATNRLRMMHAVSVVIDPEKAVSLAYKWADIKGGVSSPCELLAMVESPKFHKSDVCRSTLRFLENKGLLVKPISEVMQVAADARAELKL